MSILLLVGILCLLVLAYVAFVEPNVLKVTKLQLAFNNLPAAFDGFHIIHLTDIHSRGIGSREKKIARLVRGFNPDLVVCTGDLLSSAHLTDDPCRWLKDISRNADLYVVLGNHDVGRLIASCVVQHFFQSHAVPVLRNESVRLQRGGDFLSLMGVDDSNDGRDDIELACNGREDAGTFKILLAHSPDIQARLPHNGIDLVLSGHTHGGQICLPGFGPLRTNTKNAPRKTCRGLTRLNERTILYVSRGVGSAGPHLRFLCPPEIVSIVLRRETET